MLTGPGIILVLLFLVYVYFWLKGFKWVDKVARRNRRSAKGFKWLFFFVPPVAWVILLTIDKQEDSN